MPADAEAGLFRGLRSKELRDLAERHGVSVHGLRSKRDLIEVLLASPAAESITEELAARARAAPTAESTSDRLAATRDAIREAANLGAGVGAAEDAWKAAARSLEEGNLEAAEQDLARAARLATEARERRIKEIDTAISTVADHISAARKVGADVADAEDLRLRAADAATAQEYVLAGELIKQAERVAIQAQLRQINRAIQLRETQIEGARAIIAGCEPLLLEAESYDLNVADVRTLLRQARDVLAKGDYLAGLTFARNAEEAAYRLSSQVESERALRGIARPVPGACGACGSRHLLFYEDGWGRCTDCNVEFRWRGPLGVRERLRELLGT